MWRYPTWLRLDADPSAIGDIGLGISQILGTPAFVAIAVVIEL